MIAVEQHCRKAVGVKIMEPMSGFHGYVGMQSRGLIALPTELRRRLHLDEPGAQVEILERDDGVLELRAALPVPADQAWFWTERWQLREREVDATSTVATSSFMSRPKPSLATSTSSMRPLPIREVRDDASIRWRLPATEAGASCHFPSGRPGQVRAGM